MTKCVAKDSIRRKLSLAASLSWVVGRKSGVRTYGFGGLRVCWRVLTHSKHCILRNLDKRARETSWGDIFYPGTPFRVEVSCSKSRIYHDGAAAERIERAMTETLKLKTSQDAEITVMVRIHQDICTISVDTSGELLHKRGFKESVNKAPMRENMAALFLQQCGYKGTEPDFLSPMCGSGTFVIEAAEIAMRLNPGRARHFAFETRAGVVERHTLGATTSGEQARHAGISLHTPEQLLE